MRALYFCGTLTCALVPVTRSQSPPSRSAVRLPGSMECGRGSTKSFCTFIAVSRKHLPRTIAGWLCRARTDALQFPLSAGGLQRIALGNPDVRVLLGVRHFPVHLAASLTDANSGAGIALLGLRPCGCIPLARFHSLPPDFPCTNANQNRDRPRHPPSTAHSPRVSYSSPNSFQRRLIRCLISSAISTSSGHGRSNPSVGHLRVASMPILLPKFGSREAWSRESTGPRVN